MESSTSVSENGDGGTGETDKPDFKKPSEQAGSSSLSDSSSNRSSQLPPLSLHDCLSLGEYEMGLNFTARKTAQYANLPESAGTASRPKEDAVVAELRRQELQRLPKFLRLLSMTRPLAPMSILGPSEENQEETAVADPVVQQVVERLEHVAAIHSVAVGVDVVTCHLTPNLTRKLSRIPPLKQQQQQHSALPPTPTSSGANGNTPAGNPKDSRVLRWDTRELATVAQSPRGSASRKRRRYSEAPLGEQDDNDSTLVNDEASSEDEEMDLDGETDEPSSKRVQTHSLHRRDSVEIAAEDSPEAMVVKTISELATLVVTSLEPIKASGNTGGGNNAEGEDGDQGPQPVTSSGLSWQKGQLSLTMDDSILAEPVQDDGGVMGGSDLGSTIASIMHHAPVLQCNHVANALCRASIPQVGNLLVRIGANCPSTVAPLLSGCVEAYHLAMIHQTPSILNSAKHGARSLANLSARERSRVLLKLQTEKIMKDVQLELALDSSGVPSRIALMYLLRELGPSGYISAVIADPKTGNQKSLSRSSSRASDKALEFRSGRQSSDFDDTWHERSLGEHLSNQPNLLKKTLAFLATQIVRVSGDATTSQGELLLVLKAFVWTILVPCKKTTAAVRSEILLEDIVPKLHRLADKFMELSIRTGASTTRAESSRDATFQVFHICVLVTCARILEFDADGDSKKPLCQELALLVGEIPTVSNRVEGFRIQLMEFMQRQLPSTLGALLLHTLAPSLSVTGSQSHVVVADIEKGLGSLATLLVSGDVVEESTGSVGLLLNLNGLLVSALFQLRTSDDKTDLLSIKNLLTAVLCNEEVPILNHIREDALATFVFHATRVLCEADLLNLPLVSPVAIERNASCHSVGSERLSESDARLLLQVAHSLEFLEWRQTSPFALDPRSIPMKSLLATCQSQLSDSHLFARLLELVGNHTPEIKEQFSMRSDRSSRVVMPFEKKGGKEMADMLFARLRKCVLGQSSSENLKQIYLHARSAITDPNLHETVSSAFLASPHRPKPIVSFYSLCSDPLILLKCPMRVWHNKELRRIALATMSVLLEVNAVMVMESTPTVDVADEFLASRNAIVVRCLVKCLCSPSPDLDPIHCSTTTHFIRSCITGQSGLVASLIKQGLEENSLDWLVENVPECMNDSQKLLQLFSERSSLTPAERLVAADAVLRVAIAHGESNENDAAGMVYTALSQLLDSFFLVVGPVGVPVNALIADESGQDVTQIARKASFRMLKSLVNVRGRRKKLRKECGLALQKLASQCKSENSVAGLAGPVAGRRKALLKEIYDQVLKAANSMGNPLGSQQQLA